MTSHDTALALAAERREYTPDEPRSVLNATDVLTQNGIPQDRAEELAWSLHMAGVLK